MDEDRAGQLDRRSLIRRMAVGGAAIWATPTLHSVASAQAAVSCGPGLLDWDTFTTNSVFSSTVVGSTTVAMTISGVARTTLLANNGRVLDGPAGGVSEKHLRFEMVPRYDGNNPSRQTITFSFSTPVSLVQFSFFDIDNLDNRWGDRIEMLTPGFTSSAPAPSTVIGTGTNADPFRNSQTSNNFPNTSGQGNLLITYAGPISSFSFEYRNGGERGGQNQLISMGDISFLC